MGTHLNIRYRYGHEFQRIAAAFQGKSSIPDTDVLTAIALVPALVVPQSYWDDGYYNSSGYREGITVNLYNIGSGWTGDQQLPQGQWRSVGKPVENGSTFDPFGAQVGVLTTGTFIG